MNQWYYILEGKVQGPLTEEDIHHVFSCGALPLSTLVWHDGMPAWAEANTCKSLQHVARTGVADDVPSSSSQSDRSCQVSNQPPNITPSLQEPTPSVIPAMSSPVIAICSLNHVTESKKSLKPESETLPKPIKIEASDEPDATIRSNPGEVAKANVQTWRALFSNRDLQILACIVALITVLVWQGHNRHLRPKASETVTDSSLLTSGVISPHQFIRNVYEKQNSIALLTALGDIEGALSLVQAQNPEHRGNQISGMNKVIRVLMEFGENEKASDVLKRTTQELQKVRIADENEMEALCNVAESASQLAAKQTAYALYSKALTDFRTPNFLGLELDEIPLVMLVESVATSDFSDWAKTIAQTRIRHPLNRAGALCAVANGLSKKSKHQEALVLVERALALTDQYTPNGASSDKSAKDAAYGNISEAFAMTGEDKRSSEINERIYKSSYRVEVLARTASQLAKSGKHTSSRKLALLALNGSSAVGEDVLRSLVQAQLMETFVVLKETQKALSIIELIRDPGWKDNATLTLAATLTTEKNFKKALLLANEIKDDAHRLECSQKMAWNLVFRTNPSGRCQLSKSFTTDELEFSRAIASLLSTNTIVRSAQTKPPEPTTNGLVTGKTNDVNDDAEKQFVLGALYELGTGVEQNSALAVKYFRNAADQNHVLAQYTLGVCYHEGRGVRQDDTESARWYGKAAAQHYAEAQMALGFCYQKARGVPKDDVEAVKWFRRAAEQNDARGHYLLGCSYSLSQGVAKDDVLAYAWLSLAARTDKAAAVLRDGTKEQMSPAQINEGQKRFNELQMRFR